MLLKTSIPRKPYIKQSWNKFVLAGKVENSYVRPVIAESWIRCRNAGVNYWMVIVKKSFLKKKRKSLLKKRKI